MLLWPQEVDFYRLLWYLARAGGDRAATLCSNILPRAGTLGALEPQILAMADTETTSAAPDGEEAVEDARLDEQLSGSEELGEADSGDADAGGDAGIAAALKAWEAGGHVREEVSDPDEVRPVHFAQLEPPSAVTNKPKPTLLNNVQVDITVELGRKEMVVRELMDLKEESVIAIHKLAGEAFDILINGRPFAEGEIVVVTDMMGVRITRLHDFSLGEEEPA